MSDDVFDGFRDSTMRAIQERREAMNMTLEVLADKAGITPTLLHGLLSGHAKPTGKQLNDLVQALGGKITIRWDLRDD